MTTAPVLERAGLRRVIQSRLEEVDALCRDLRAHCQEKGWAAMSFPLELVLRECLNNAILHGNRSDPSKAVVVSVVCRRPWLRVQIADEGDGFDWSAVQARTLPDADKTNGRGLLIASTYAHRVRFNPSGNQITLWFQQLPKSNSSDL
jgi:serine/threonine-protein kinase RsbW